MEASHHPELRSPPSLRELNNNLLREVPDALASLPALERVSVLLHSPHLVLHI